MSNPSDLAATSHPRGSRRKTTVKHIRRDCMDPSESTMPGWLARRRSTTLSVVTVLSAFGQQPGGLLPR
jgi:hypothetical protein